MNNDMMSDGCMCCMMSTSSEDEFFAQCLGPFLPQVNFCIDPATAENNPDGMVYECMHECELLWHQDDYAAAEAAGCHNNHEDEVCLTVDVYAPGAELPWGEVCCEWCEDWDGDGSPNYEGCCEGMRPDGEMGCEHSDCHFMCEGLHCSGHEDQSLCEASGGTWAEADSCAGQIAMQPMWALQMESDGAPSYVASAWWLGELGEACCTGYEVPGPGSCDSDSDQSIYVSTWFVVLLRHVVCARFFGADAVPRVVMPVPAGPSNALRW